MSKTLGLYVHIPFCRSKCDYCDFYSLAGREDRMDDYQKALIAQISEGAPLARGYTVNSIYIGGGTPSWYGEKRLCELLRLLQKKFKMAKDIEVTVEANPDSVTEKALRAVRRAGSIACPWGCSPPATRSYRMFTGPTPFSRWWRRSTPPEKPRLKI